jgi:hypothetical protein
MSKNALQNPNPCAEPGTRSPFRNTSLANAVVLAAADRAKVRHGRGLAKGYYNMDYIVKFKDD